MTTPPNPQRVPEWRRAAPPGVPLSTLITAAPPPPPDSDASVAMALQRIIRPEARWQWVGLRARDYTPERIEVVLRNALAGDHQTQWELFALMEDTWPRLGKALAELKREVVQLDWRLEPWAEAGAAPTPEAQRRHAVVEHALWTMRPRADEPGNGFEDTVHDLLDAWAKGLSVLEIEWATRPGPRSEAGSSMIAAPLATYWVHPKHYAWSESGWLGLRFASDVARGITTPAALMPLPQDKFLVGICRARSGPVLGAALLRPLAWWWCAANFSAAWLLNLAQIFGLPIRWATYAPGSPQSLINEICNMLENMGSAAWGAFPAGTAIELKEPSKTGGSWPQDSLLDRADRQCDLLILGQTLTTDVADSGSRALGNVHKSVRDQIIAGAASWVAGVLNRQFIPAICRLNWGDDAECPELCPKPVETADLQADATRFQTLIQAGLPIPKEWLYRQQQIPIPQEGEDVVERQAAPDPFGPGGFGGPFQQDPSAEDEETAEAVRARFRRTRTPRRTDRERRLEEIVDLAARDLGARRAWLAPLNAELRRLADLSADDERTDAEVVRLIEAGRRRLPELFADIDANAFAEHLTGVLGAAARSGAEER